MDELKQNPLEKLAGEGGGTPGATVDEDRAGIVRSLTSYWQEADMARKGGLNPRDDKWEENLNLYWGRYDFSKKAPWQAKEVLPEVSTFVDRFAAALKEALMQGDFYTVEDPADEEKDLAKAVKRLTDVWLKTTGSNQNGQPLDFPAVFEEQVKLGALMSMASVVVWKNDVPGGRVAIETVDPRNVWFDNTYRNLYRVRRAELDRHELFDMALAKDGKGNSIYNLEEVAKLTTHVEAEYKAQLEQLTGTGQEQSSSRKPIQLDEYYAKILRSDGTVMYDRALCVVANGQFLVRGPEPNPFWHGRDWLTYTPLITTPLSAYGRSYMEDFASIAKTFNELTNLILDAVFTSSLNAFAMVPGMLQNPEQVSEGIWPNKIFMLEDGFNPVDFAKALELGKLPPESVTVWQNIKNELREAAGINEIGLGQFAPKGRTSATEVQSTQESSSAMIRSVAQTIETRWLNPTLDMTWKTGLQYSKQDDARLAAAAGPDMYAALWGRRKELIKRPITFKADGISKLIQKAKTLRSLLQAMQIIGANPLLLQEFLKVADMKKLVELIFDLSDIDLYKLQVSQRDLLMRQVVQGFQNAAGGAGGAPAGGEGVLAEPGAAEMTSLAQSIGVANG